MRTGILCIFLFGASLGASPVGSIIGQVKDPSNALVLGAKLTLTNLATNEKLETVTDANGAFRFLQLPPAEYSVVAQAVRLSALRAATAASRTLPIGMDGETMSKTSLWLRLMDRATRPEMASLNAITEAPHSQTGDRVRA